MKEIKILLIFLLLTSCQDKNMVEIKRNYILNKSDDNNWTTSAIIECDSVDMINETHAIYWIDGRKSNLYGKLIKIYTNTSK